MSYEALIFDLDGTLLDTIDDLADAANNTLTEMGFPTHEVDAYKYFVGNGIEKLMEKALPENKRDDKTIKEAVKIQRKNYADNWDNKTKPYTGIIEMLKQLNQKNVSISILSNKPDDFTKLCVSQMLPVHLFDIVQGARDGVPIKPNPTGALEIAGRLGVLAEDIVYVGDTDTDMKTGKAAGMYAIGVLWGFREEQELLDNGADKIISTPEELVDLI